MLRRITSVLDNMVDSMISRLCTGDAVCHGAISAAAFIKQLKDATLWPSSEREERPLEDVVHDLMRFEYRCPSRSRCNCSGDPCILIPDPGTAITGLRNEVQMLQSQLRTPCILCVRKAQDGLKISCGHR